MESYGLFCVSDEAFWLELRRQRDLDTSPEGHITARKAWSHAARKRFHPGPRKPCEVCSGHPLTTHAHHVTPLAMQFEAGLLVPVQAFAWVCPNHHSLIHLVLEQKPWDVGGVTPAERGEILRLADAGLRLL